MPIPKFDLKQPIREADLTGTCQVCRDGLKDEVRRRRLVRREIMEISAPARFRSTHLSFISA